MNRSTQEGLTVLIGAGLIYYLYTQGKLSFLDKLFKGGGGTGQTPGTGGPSSPPSTIPGTVLYDSANGWTGVRTSASGDPQFSEGADGSGRLESGPGHGRIYIDVKNYNSVMELEFMFESGEIENMSLRLRSRHGEADPCENRFGGFGSTLHLDDDTISFGTEICHNEHENDIEGPAPKPFELGVPYKVRYYCVDSADKSSVKFRTDIDYGDGAGFVTGLTGEHPSPQPYYLDEASFQEASYIWIRLNNNDIGGRGSLLLKSLKIISQEAGSLDNQTTAPAAYARAFNGRVSKVWANPIYNNHFYSNYSKSYRAMTNRKPVQRKVYAPDPILPTIVIA